MSNRLYGLGGSLDQAEAIERRQAQLEEILNHVKSAIQNYGLKHFRETGVDLSAREAFEMVLQIEFEQRYQQTNGITNPLWKKITDFKLN